MTDLPEGKVISLQPLVQKAEKKKARRQELPEARLQELETVVDKLVEVVQHQKEEIQKLSDRQWKILRRLREVIEADEVAQEVSTPDGPLQKRK